MDQFSNILLSDLSRATYQQDLHLHQFLTEAILPISGLKNLSYHCSDDRHAGYSQQLKNHGALQK